jgi:hypothetical protein
MCQIQNLLTQTPEEHLVVTDSSPKVYNAVLTAPMSLPPVTAFQSRRQIARTPGMHIARRFRQRSSRERYADVGSSNK